MILDCVVTSTSTANTFMIRNLLSWAFFFAIAKDQSGWHHIDQLGQSLYPFRFENLEPFYNGIAKAVTISGVDVLIDEKGKISPLMGQLNSRKKELVSFPLPILEGNVKEKEKQLREQLMFVA